jgi:WG containing repeat
MSMIKYLILIQLVLVNPMFSQNTEGLEFEWVVRPGWTIIKKDNVNLYICYKDHKTLLVNSKNGKIISLPDSCWVGDFKDGLAAVVVGSKLGYIDTMGKIVIPLQFYMGSDDEMGYDRYEKAVEFSDGLAKVTFTREGKYGFIDKKGKIVIPLQFDHADKFQEGLAFFTKADTTGFINKNGNIVFLLPLRDSDSIEYYFPTDFSEGLAAIPTSRGLMYMDKSGKFVIQTSLNYGSSALRPK